MVPQFHRFEISENSCLKGCVSAFENPCDRFNIVYNFCGQVIEIRLDKTMKIFEISEKELRSNLNMKVIRSISAIMSMKISSNLT